MRVAILVDGGFFIRRWKFLKPSTPFTGEDYAREIHRYCMRHVKEERDYLYRIFFYDCPPLAKKLHLPLSKRAIDFQRLPQCQMRFAMFSELKSTRKVALRLGHLNDSAVWRVKDEVSKDLTNGKREWASLTDEDFFYDTKQKGVDSRIACDIASLAFKKQVDKIILISGDADFVPAAKLARREGVDFVLDPLHNHIDQSLYEHIDGCHSIPLHGRRAGRNGAPSRLGGQNGNRASVE